MNKFEKQIQKQIDTAKAKIARAKSNMEFARMSAPQKRFQIAKDVLLLLAASPKNRPHVQCGTYFSVDTGNLDKTIDLQEVATTSPDLCTVCGIGAMFLAHVRKMDGVTLTEGGEIDFSSALTDEMESYFPLEQFMQIECAFERGNANRSSVPDELGAQWGRAIQDDEDRLRAICENIIRNKGTFRIRQIPAGGRG